MSESATLDTLLGYLAQCGGCDRFEFHHPHGDPDPVAARAFAENMRAKYGASIGSAITVEQIANRVTVCTVTLAAAV